MAIQLFTNPALAQTSEENLQELAQRLRESQSLRVDIPAPFQHELEMRSAVDQSIEKLRNRIKELETMEAISLSLRAFDDICADFYRIGAQLFLSSSVVTTPSLRKAADRESQRMEEFWIDEFLADESLFVKLKKIELEQKRLSPQERAHLDQLLKYFRFYHPEEEDLKSGEKSSTQVKLELLDNQQRLQNLSKTADRIALEFERNVFETKKTLLFRADELEGLPEWFLETSRTGPDEYRVDVHTWWQYSLVMKLARSAKTRMKVDQARDSIAQEVNLTLGEALFETRQLLAEEFGLESWLEHQLMELTFDNEDHLREFLENMLAANAKSFRAEQSLVKKWKRRQTRQSKVKVFHWDWMYYLNQELENTYQFKEDEFREYFPFRRVLDVFLRKLEKFYHIRFEESDTPMGWPAEVMSFHVFDNKTQQLLGILLLDPFPRKGKDSWFFNYNLNPRRQLANAEWQLPVTLVHLNAPPATDSRPSLLTLEDITTLAHEFGHALHDLLTEAQFSTISGTSSAEDFVETPSSFMESWVLSADFIKELSSHWQTGAQLPSNWLENWETISQMGEAHSRQKRLAMALVDLSLHGRDYRPGKANETEHKVRGRFFYPAADYANPLASNTYLTSGYDGLFWIYVFGDLLSSAFEDKFKDNLFDPEIAERFRREVLAVGGEKSTPTIARKFLGKKFDPCAAALQRLPF